MFSKVQKTKEPDNREKAYDYAVFLLSLKLRTVGEILTKMQARGYTEGVIQQILDRLQKNRYLDDERYGEIFLENLKLYKNFGFYGIKKKFMEKKIPQNLIDQTLQAGLPIDEEIKIAQRLLKKEGFTVKPASTEVQYRTFGDENENKEAQKMAQKLKARGFRSEVISRLVF